MPASTIAVQAGQGSRWKCHSEDGTCSRFGRQSLEASKQSRHVWAKGEGKRLGRPRIAPELEERIRKALATPGRPGVRKIAERFGVDPGTVQRISRPRPFVDGAASVVV